MGNPLPTFLQYLRNPSLGAPRFYPTLICCFDCKIKKASLVHNTYIVYVLIMPTSSADISA